MYSIYFYIIQLLNFIRETYFTQIDLHQRKKYNYEIIGYGNISNN